MSLLFLCTVFLWNQGFFLQDVWCNTVCLSRDRQLLHFCKSEIIHQDFVNLTEARAGDVYNSFQFHFSTVQSAFKSTSIQEHYSISTSSLIIKAEKNVLTTVINGNLIIRINCQGVSQPAAVVAHVEPGGYHWAVAALKRNGCLQVNLCWYDPRCRSMRAKQTH